jgi:hypothetical protein
MKNLYGERLSFTNYLGRIQNKESDPSKETVRDPLDKQGGALAAAEGGGLGDMFEYTIEDRVSLPRQKSALLPIVNEAVEGSRVSIYNGSVMAKHPLLGLMLNNKTKLHLAQGPVAVYDSGTYAGDARMPDLKPNESRLLSYAIDLGTEVVFREETLQAVTDGITVTPGWLEVDAHQTIASRYLVRNRNPQDRTLIIEHPRHEGRKLTSPVKPNDQTRSFYRFELKVKSGELATFDVQEEIDNRQTIRLTLADPNLLLYYAKHAKTKPAVADVLRKVIEFKDKIAEASKGVQAEMDALKEIADDQDRMRKNIERAPKESDTFKRYLKKFDEQETEIEKRQSKLKELKAGLAKLEKELHDYAQAQ